MEQRLNRSDVRFIAGCGILALIALLVGSHYFYQAFPEATIDFKITRDDARERAGAFLQHRGLEIEGYRHSAIFTYDGVAKTFLERELGLDGTMAVIDNPVRLWRWSNRWVKERQKEEFRVEYTTAGDLVGFTHEIEEEKEGAQLGQVEARYLAEQFLSHSMERRLSELVFVEAETTERPNRTDHSFTWKLVDFEIEEATYRLRVGIQGDLVGSYGEFLKIPEAWEREYQKLRAQNNTTGSVASAFMMFTWIAMIVVLVISIRAQDIRWKTVIVFGAIAFVLTFLAQLNMLPVTEYGFDTTQTYGSFLTRQLLFGLLIALFSGIGIAVLTAGAEPVYRRGFGDHISLTEQFLPDGIRTKRFLIGTILGLTLTAVSVAYQSVFYLVADKLGAWSPADIPYSEMVNTHIPWVVVLLIGFMPAVSEEFTSRAFSIPFLQRLLRRRWLAVLIPAIIWGFAHAGYPQQPFYIRGIEVGLIGILLGVVMIRWGLLPVLVWHYTLDALYTALILLRSTNRYFVVSAALSVGIMLLPLLAAVILYVRHRFFIDATSLLNAEDSPPLIEPKAKPRGDLTPEAQLSDTSDAEISYTPLPLKRLLTAAAIVLASCVVFLVDVEKPLDFVDFAVTPKAAERRATAHLVAQGVETDSFRTVVSGSFGGVDANVVKYRMERQGIAAVNRLYREHLQPAHWQVRYFIPLQKEEYRVFVDVQDSSVYRDEHLLEEAAPGADLPEDEARAIAERHLKLSGLDPGAFDLKEALSEKLEARRDHDFVWEASAGDPRNLDESYFRCRVHVSGDEPTSLNRFIKLPEEWLRDREESTTLQAVLQGLLIAAMVFVVLHMGWLLIQQLRGGDIEWRPLLWLGGVGGVISLLSTLNDLPTLYAGYPTQTQESLYLVMQIVGFILGPVFIAILVAACVALATTLYPDCLKQLGRRRRAGYLVDGLWVALLAYIVNKAVNRLELLANGYFAEYADPPGLSAIAGLDTLLPLWNGLSNSLVGAFGMPLTMGIVIYYALRVLKRPAFIVGVALAFGLVSAAADAHNLGEFCLDFATFLISTGITAAVVIFLLRDNIPAYVLYGFLSATFDGAYRMLSQSATLFQVHGWIWLVLAVTAIATLWLQSRNQSTRGTTR